MRVRDIVERKYPPAESEKDVCAEDYKRVCREL